MSVDFGLLLIRMIVGMLFIGHGAQKLFGWFGGPGLEGTASWLGSLGLRPRTFWAVMAGLSEAGGGLLVLLGFMQPLGALGVTAAMVMAMVTVHWGKLWAQDGGIELPLVYLTVVTGVAIAGPGLYSLDSVLGLNLPMPLTWIVGLVAVAIGITKALRTAKRPAPALESMPSAESPSQAA